MLNQLDLHLRAKAAGWHLLISLGVAAFAAALVFGLWYPGAYRLLSGGQSLFFLVVAVDVVLGPVLTFSVFNLKKGWPHLRRDLAVIGSLQLVGLAYGLHTVYIARPVATVFEVDRYRIVTANNVNVEELPRALPEYQRLPITGPWMLSVREAKPGDERNEALFMALNGVDTSMRPSFWQPYTQAKTEVLRRMRPMKLLVEKYKNRQSEIEATLVKAGVQAADVGFLPVVARGDWVAVVDRNAAIVAYLPLDGFF
jgi:hypothetical protein